MSAAGPEVYVFQEDYRDHSIYKEVTEDEYYTQMQVVGRCVADTLTAMHALIDENLEAESRFGND